MGVIVAQMQQAPSKAQDWRDSHTTLRMRVVYSVPRLSSFGASYVFFGIFRASDLEGGQ